MADLLDRPAALPDVDTAELRGRAELEHSRSSEWVMESGELTAHMRHRHELPGGIVSD